MSPSISTSNTTTTTTSTTTTKSSPTTSSSSGQSGTANSACAACRHQRRRCKPDCTLAPYFPANDQHKFLNAHRLFGVSNIIKIIANLDPVQRNDAMRTIIFQSDMRAQDPVGGCYHIVDDLERQIKHCLAELQLVHRQLSIFRAQAARAADLDVIGPGAGPFPPGAAQDICVVDPDAVNIYDPNLYLSQQQQQFYSNNYFCFDNDVVNGHDQDNLNINGTDFVVDDHNVDVCDNMLNTLRQQQQQPCMVMGDEEEAKPLVDMFGVRTLMVAADHHGDSFRNNVSSTCDLNGSYDLHGRSLELKEEVNQEHDLKEIAAVAAADTAAAAAPTFTPPTELSQQRQP